MKTCGAERSRRADRCVSPAAQVSDVNFSVGRSPANQLTVVCESSGWSPEPLVSLLDPGSADVPDAQRKVSVRPDGLFSVRALINLTAGKGKHESGGV